MKWEEKKKVILSKEEEEGGELFTGWKCKHLHKDSLEWTNMIEKREEKKKMQLNEESSHLLSNINSRDLDDVHVLCARLTRTQVTVNIVVFFSSPTNRYPSKLNQVTKCIKQMARVK